MSRPAAAVILSLLGLAGCTGGPSATETPARSSAVKPASAAPGRIVQPAWLAGVRITEYWPVPEHWFRGRRVRASGLSGRHRVDWIYSALGLSREEDGVALDGRRYHVEELGHGGWVNRSGRPVPVDSPAVYWRAGAFWRNARGVLTFPLERGGWSNGIGVRYVPLPGVRFAPGPSLALRYYRSLAVDPRVIPLGSRVYIPTYRALRGGWFTAQDTGGSISGAHVDVFRPAPSSPDGGRDLYNRRIYVVPPGYPVPAQAPPG